MALLLFSYFFLINSKDLPKWPKTYTLKGVWRIPYGKVNEPFIVYTDYNKKRQVESAYEGLQHTIHILSNRSYQLQPNVDHMTCLFSDMGETDSLHEYLPLNNNEWIYKGEVVVLGKKADMWEKITHPTNGWYYRFYACPHSGNPIRIFNHGQSLRHSHPADYYYDISEFAPGIDETAFILPTDCKNVDTAGPVLSNDISKPGKRRSENSITCPIKVPTYEGELPNEFSWRNIPNALPIPRDQSNCGSCWAEAAAQGISALFSIMLIKITSISIQQFMDCTWGPRNHACQGGESDDGLRYLIQANRSLALEEIGRASCRERVSDPV